MHPSLAHEELMATYQRAKAAALHKRGLISAAARKGPKAIQAAVETAAKADKRKDALVKKLAALGVVVEESARPMAWASRH